MTRLKRASMEGNMKSESLPETKVVAAAKQRILHQPHLTMQRIWCEFDEGRLYLRGQVPSFYHKQLAQVAVAGMDGVGQVVNDIEVVW
jgi:osmotically-inducible protein OsmY